MNYCNDCMYEIDATKTKQEHIGSKPSLNSMFAIYQIPQDIQVNNFHIHSLFRQLSQNMTTDFLLDCSSFY